MVNPIPRTSRGHGVLRPDPDTVVVSTPYQTVNLYDLGTGHLLPLVPYKQSVDDAVAGYGAVLTRCDDDRLQRARPRHRRRATVDPCLDLPCHSSK